MLAEIVEPKLAIATPQRKSPWRIGDKIETPQGQFKIRRSKYIASIDEWVYTFQVDRQRRVPRFVEVEYKESRLKRWHDYLAEDEWDLLALWAGAY